MTTDRDMEHIVRSWLQPGLTTLADDVLDAVLDQLPATPQRRSWWPARRLTRVSAPVRIVIAAAAAAIVVVVGINLMPDVRDLGAPAASSPAASLTVPPSASATPAGGEAVRGWPSTVQNPPGLYSWDGSRCAGQSCTVGFMHNGYGPGDVEIRISAGGLITDDRGTPVTVAGHDGIYRRIDAQHEEWIVNVERTTITIRLEARPGANPANVAEAHAIIESMRTEPSDNVRGFRLVFTLTTDDWDSG